MKVKSVTNQHVTKYCSDAAVSWPTNLVDICFHFNLDCDIKSIIPTNCESNRNCRIFQNNYFFFFFLLNSLNSTLLPCSAGSTSLCDCLDKSQPHHGRMSFHWCGLSTFFKVPCHPVLYGQWLKHADTSLPCVWPPSSLWWWGQGWSPVPTGLCQLRVAALSCARLAALRWYFSYRVFLQQLLKAATYVKQKAN